MSLQKLSESAPEGYLEVRGVSAGEFDPALWQAGGVRLLPDLQHPLLEPREGPSRNIYAPSVVEIPDGWRVFYGAWDGSPTGNDRIYSAVTREFLSFEDRHTVIEHGKFQHVCNVSAAQLPGGAISLMCTAYPDERGLNKPAFFHSPDGKTWNGSPAPYTATADDIVTVSGYAKYADADINGMNVILHEEGAYRLYFCNFRDFGHVFRASSKDGRNFDFDGVALEKKGMVNDVKKFRVGGDTWYLMGGHANGPTMWYAMSRDGSKFDQEHELLKHADDADKYIVALGWVVSGEQEKPGRKLLGVLYGAGAVPQLDQNRIFARWLQKRATLVMPDGKRIEATHAMGPDRQLISLPAGAGTAKATLELRDESGEKVLATSQIEAQPGTSWQVAR